MASKIESEIVKTQSTPAIPAKLEALPEEILLYMTKFMKGRKSDQICVSWFDTNTARLGNKIWLL